jgi:hypothetical protein
VLLLLSVFALAAAGLGLAWVSNRFGGVQGWAAHLGALALAAGVLALGWRLLRGEGLPHWLFALLLGAALLRLGAAALWYTALPTAGYGSQAELGGYVMADAAERDRAAWELAKSEKPLLRAFQGSYRKNDQYGGMLYLSAAVYRLLGGGRHYPLLMAAIGGAFSSLAILFMWAVCRRAWDAPTANLAAWILALYPEAVLLGSSQMREAYMVTLTAAALYGLLLAWQEQPWRGAAWALGALLLTLPFSPPLGGLLAAALGLLAPAGFNASRGVLRRLARRRRFWLALGGLALLAGAAAWLASTAWEQLPPEAVRGPLSVVGWWLRKSADFQAYLSMRASGWMQKVFNNTPEWTHLWLLLVYGVSQPLLPAALADITGAPIWRGIAIWRSLGWTPLLILLVYALLRAWGRRPARGLAPWLERGLSLAAWLAILAASFRGGGDPWDNPRYRAAFAGLQVALAAWAWMEQRRQPDPLLRRVLAGLGLILAWLMPWYLRRYIHINWPVEDFFKSLGLGAASAALFWLADWVSPRRKGAPDP